MNMPRNPKKYLNFREQIKSKVVRIKNKNPNLGNYGYLARVGGSTIGLYTGTGVNSGYLDWIMYSLDGGKYIFVNKMDGVILKYTSGDKYITDTDNYTDSLAEQWTLETDANDLNVYYIRHVDTGFLLQASDVESLYDEYYAVYPGATEPDLDAPYTNDSYTNQIRWTIEFVTDFNLPEKPQINELPGFPQLTASNRNKDLPDTSPVLTGWTLIPTPMVTDGSRTLQQRLQDAPYYILQKKQYWTKLFQITVHPNDDFHKTVKYEQTDTEKTTMTSATGITVTKDAGFTFGLNALSGGSGSIKETVKNDLRVTESQSVQKRTETENKIEFTNNYGVDMDIAKYVLQTELTLYLPLTEDRADDVLVSRYIYNDPNIIQTTAYMPQTSETLEMMKNQKRTRLKAHLDSDVIRDTGDPNVDPNCSNPF